jgi:LacI family transcriptional regulator
VEDSLSVDTASLLLCDARRDAVRERHYLDVLASRRVDGLIVTGRATDPAPPVPRNLPFPVVYAYTTSSSDEDFSITVDDEHGGWLAARQLLNQGCRQIAHVTGPVPVLAVRERIDGARRALAEAGMDLPDERIVHGRFAERTGYDAVQRLLGDRQIDGIFCGSDQIARGAADSLAMMGLRVPEDVSIVGFDNWTIVAAATRPPLCSIDKNLYRLGRLSAEHLLAATDGKVESGVQRLPCSVAVRTSCPAPVTDGTEWRDGTPLVPDA